MLPARLSLTMRLVDSRSRETQVSRGHVVNPRQVLSANAIASEMADFLDKDHRWPVCVIYSTITRIASRTSNLPTIGSPG
jgi:hypothetical protein